MGRIATGGALGALPGLLIAVVPVLLHELGVISSDQSQIGFVGLPLLIIGTFVGIAVAASDSGCDGAALLGAGAGLVVGLVVGVLGGSAVTGLAGVWLVAAPLGMIGGATLAVALRWRRR